MGDDRRAAWAALLSAYSGNPPTRFRDWGRILGTCPSTRSDICGCEAWLQSGNILDCLDWGGSLRKWSSVHATTVIRMMTHDVRASWW